MKEFIHFLAKFFRELSDEAAYKRYLELRGVVPSRAEWQRFSEQKLRNRYSQSKCC